MATRKSDLTTGVSTGTSTNADAVNPGDTPNFGQTNDLYARRKSFFDSTATVASIRAITPAQRADIQMVRLKQDAFWEFRLGSVAVDDGVTILEPDDDVTVSGRWHQDSGGSGGGAGAGISIDLAEQQCDLKQSGALNVGFDNGICGAFTEPKPKVEGFLLRNYTAGTELELALNPRHLKDSNKDSSFDAAYSVVGSTDTIDSLTGLIGTSPTCTSWNKTTGTTQSGIEIDLGAGNEVNLSAHRTLLVQLRLDVNTNIQDFEIRLSPGSSTATNHRSHLLTADSEGNAITGLAGSTFHLFKFDLDLAGTVGGTDFDITADLMRSVAWIVNTTSSTQLYTDLAVESIAFQSDDGSLIELYKKIVQPGTELSIVDNSNQEDVIIDSATIDVIGKVTIDSALSNTYSGGTVSTLRRSTLEQTGNKRVEFSTEGGLTSGSSNTRQTLRLRKHLKEALANATFDISEIYDTQLFFFTEDTPTSLTVTVTDTVDFTTELLTGDKLHIVKVIENDNGRPSYVYSGTDITLSINSAASGGVTTFTTATAAEITAVDTAGTIGTLLFKEGQLDVFLSLVNLGVDESFGSAITRSEIIITDVALPYPKANAIFGHYLKIPSGDPTTTQAATQAKLGAPGVDLSITGSVNVGREFFNFQTGAGIYSATDYFSIPAADTGNLDPDSAAAGGIAGSMWVFPIGSPTGNDVLITRSIITTRNPGWSILHLSTGAVALEINASQVAVSAVMTTDIWHHVAWVITDGGTADIWLDGVRTDGGTAVIGTTSQDLFIGRWATGGDQAVLAYMADLVLWSAALGSNELTDAEVASIHSNGMARVFGSNAGFRYRYQETSLSGQSLSLKVNARRRTSTFGSPVALQKLAAIKTN